MKACNHNYDDWRSCTKCGARTPADHPREVNRARVVAYRSANNFAVLRESAKAWGQTDIGRHMRALLAAIDAGTPLDPELLTEIRMRGYQTGSHGDSFSDGIHALLGALPKAPK